MDFDFDAYPVAFPGDCRRMLTTMSRLSQTHYNKTAIASLKSELQGYTKKVRSYGLSDDALRTFLDWHYNGNPYREELTTEIMQHIGGVQSK